MPHKKFLVGLGIIGLVMAAASCANNHPERGFTQHQQFFLRLYIPTLYLDHTQPPKLVATTPVRVSDPFDLTGNQGVGALRGRIERDGGRFHAKLEGNCEGTWNLFEGDLELEKPVSATGMVFSGYIISGLFLLTTNADCGPFLRRQAVLDKEIAGMK